LSRIKGINTAGQALHQKQIRNAFRRDLRPPAAASAASRGVLNPSVPHSLDHTRASTVAISLRSSIMNDHCSFSAPHSSIIHSPFFIFHEICPLAKTAIGQYSPNWTNLLAGEQLS
jgi:hypothetical protein